MQLLPDDFMDDELLDDEDEEDFDGEDDDDEDGEDDDDYDEDDGENEDDFEESVLFDGIDFVRDGANRLVTADGVTAYEDWCRTCLSTEQGSLFCYPDDFGIDTSEIPYATSRGEVETILMKEITDALMADGRTSSVEDIEFEWNDDGDVEAHISVVGTSNEEVNISVNI